MELIAGEFKFDAEVKEHNCTFIFDFSRVYWNSRLSTEHTRMVAMWSKGDNICDMFCGVGPFAVPAAKKGCNVYANDLNPTSYEYLLKNIAKNKISAKNIHPNNGDARAYIRACAAKQMNGIYLHDIAHCSLFMCVLDVNCYVICMCYIGGEVPWFRHIAMNLPAAAPEFLGNTNRCDLCAPAHCYSSLMCV
jgi:tRNA G37 N-methylase Trm5